MRQVVLEDSSNSLQDLCPFGMALHLPLKDLQVVGPASRHKCGSKSSETS